jgi:hypothetical protein
MKAIGSLIMVVATVIVCGVFLYQHAPNARRIPVPGKVRLMAEVRPRKVTQSVAVDGKKVDVEVIANDTVYREVREVTAASVVIEPNATESLKYWVLVFCIAALAVYGTFVFCLWARDKWSRLEGKDTDDMNRRLSEIGKLCGAVVLTLFGVGDLSKPPVSSQHNEIEHNAVSNSVPDDATTLSYAAPIPKSVVTSTAESSVSGIQRRNP